MIDLDTTILVYAKGADHPLRDPCRRLIAAIEEGRVLATTTSEVIQEFVHVRASDAIVTRRSSSDWHTPSSGARSSHPTR